ncbi:MAG TPA: hypothetical protein VFE50_12355 [Cyclobacteriaceae bacterium]|nr:hypothetical protein [Cyclobacteriaceae bacterium]
MRSLLVTVTLVFTCLVAQAQTVADTIEVRKKQFRQDGRPLKPKQLMNIMSTNPEALQEMKIAKKNADAANVFGFIGGALIGWPLGTAAGGGKPNWGLAAAGVGVLLVAIPFGTSYTRHARTAVDIYNRDLKRSAARVRFRAGVGPTSASLRVTF